MDEPVLFEVDQGVAVITLNRPERRNAINEALLRGLYEGIDRAAADDAIKAVIITGNGKAFCSGLDLDCLATDNLIDPRGDGRDMVVVMAECKKPVIGAVNGHAITGGFELALNCDFLIASEKAVFIDTHAKVGIHPGWGMTQFLQQAVGQRLAKQFSLTCQPITAEKALQCGLVNEVVAPAALLDRTKEIACQFCAVHYELALTIKERIDYRNTTTFEAALAKEREGFKKILAGNT
ncbi:MAG: enoyl-CoA hydratase [Thermodesulfobacteriota bacterium]|nr:enoyl-CoA hydratase [Thermodesulfobacteriota bacterium]